MASDPSPNELPDLTLPEKLPKSSCSQPLSDRIQSHPQDLERITAATDRGSVLDPDPESRAENSWIAWGSLVYAVFATSCLCIPDTPHVGDPERPVRSLFLYGVLLVPGIWMAMIGIRKGGPNAGLAWLALIHLEALFLLVVALFLAFLLGIVKLQ